MDSSAAWCRPGRPLLMLLLILLTVAWLAWSIYPTMSSSTTLPAGFSVPRPAPFRTPSLQVGRSLGSSGHAAAAVVGNIASRLPAAPTSAEAVPMKLRVEAVPTEAPRQTAPAAMTTGQRDPVRTPSTVLNSAGSVMRAVATGTGKCKSILLLVLFNHAYYDNIPLLRSMYGRLAGKMVFYGPEEDKARGVRRSVDQLHGFLQHQSIAQAWRDNPGFDGVLWMADDMFVNLPLLFGDPKFSWDRIWLWNRTSPLIKDCEAHPIVVNLNHIPNIWHFGHPYANDNVHHADTLVANWRKDLPQRYTKRQMHLFGEERIHAHGSDFGYIPKPLMPEFLAVVDIKSLRNLEFELFVPTFLRLLSDNPDDVVSWNGRYFWVPHVCPHWSKAFDCNRDHTMHPLKLSSQEHRAQIAGLPCNPERVSTADIQHALDC